MSCHQSFYVGPYLQYWCPSPNMSTGDLLGNERLVDAHPMLRPESYGHVLIPNGSSRSYGHEDVDSASPVTVKDVTQSVVKFQKEFAKEIAALDAAHGTKGEVHFGVVVSWS